MPDSSRRHPATPWLKMRNSLPLLRKLRTQSSFRFLRITAWAAFVNQLPENLSNFFDFRGDRLLLSGRPPKGLVKNHTLSVMTPGEIQRNKIHMWYQAAPSLSFEVDRMKWLMRKHSPSELIKVSYVLKNNLTWLCVWDPRRWWATGCNHAVD
jgi:hypothetical protein